MRDYLVAQLDEIDAVNCPCGASRRAFLSPGNSVATVHMVDIPRNRRSGLCTYASPLGSLP